MHNVRERLTAWEAPSMLSSAEKSTCLKLLSQFLSAFFALLSSPAVEGVLGILATERRFNVSQHSRRGSTHRELRMF